ncbi:MAG: sugar-transfer associated ATP-grasp domain-containing protein [Candidatus Dojkabacteria bacterium]|jgi:alpha-L-glutamate ligase-like protein|nr:sugar-transfer associated ATP-grasp domain-containing protein [Candidatus Dojkabacteria bacterium]
MTSSILKLNKEVLGLNRRNQEYVRPYNPPSSKAIADNKILTKRVLRKELIQTPEVYKLIRSKKQLQFLDWESLPKSFVIKPNQGTGGNGIIVFYGKKKGELEWIRPNGTTMNQRDIILHIENILEGRFSMGSKTDTAIIEERIKTDPLLKQYSYRGVPDIRIICFNSVPVMAMLRLPTRRSNGTANLHSGAICTGIDIGTGITTYSMQMKKNIFLSDTYELIDSTVDLKDNKPLSGIQIPNWDKILEIALKCQKVSGLGYIGVDIALDIDKGPVVFEINARPGLGIQVANQAGLRWRLEKVKDLKIKGIRHGMRVSKNLFGGEIEESIEAISGRQVLNITEKISLYDKSTDISKIGKSQKIKKELVKAFMDTGVLTSRIDSKLANRIGYINAHKEFTKLEVPKKFESFKQAQEYIDKYEEKISESKDIKRLAKIVEDGDITVRPVFEIPIKILDKVKITEFVSTQYSDTPYQVTIGRSDLTGYLIDTSNTF